MKIAHIISTFPPRVGGMGVVCMEEVKRQATANEVAVFTLLYPDSDDGGREQPFKVFCVKPLFKFGDAGLVFGFTQKLKGFDVVHLHYPFYGALGSLIRAKKILGFSLVVTYHMDSQGVGVKKRLQNIYDRLYGKKIFKLADKVIAVDENYFKESMFGRGIGKEKSVVLANGVDTRMYCPGRRDWTALGHPELADKRVILFVGNLLAVKNVEFLISLLPDLSAETVLVIVGGGYEEERVKQRVGDSNFKQRVLFVGKKIDKDDLIAYYRSADIVAIPSVSESFSLVALEALSCGSIIIASDIAGIRGRINNGSNGLLAPVNDRIAWLAAIEEVWKMNDEERRIIAGKARETAYGYDWNNHVSALAEIYRSVT